MLSGDLLLGKRRIPPVTRLHREAGGAQGVRSIRIAQGTVNKLGGGALRGSARVRAALLHSGRPGSLAHRRAQQQICLHQPAAYRLPTHGGERAGAARGGGGRGDGRRLEERGAARRGPRRPTIQQHHCAPHRVLAHTHRPAPYRARGAAPISPTSVSWPSPPRAERGSARTDPELRALAIKQLTTAVGPHAGARSSFHGVPDSQQRDARAPAAAPTAARRTPAITDRQYRHPLAEERTQPENSSRTSQAAD